MVDRTERDHTSSKSIPEEKPCRAPKNWLPQPPASNFKTREQRLAGAGNQPVCLWADVWEGTIWSGPPQGMKANRSFEKLGACLSRVCSRPHTPQGWPSLFVCLALHHPQGSSLLFSHTVCLTSGRCNVTPWGWGNNEGVISLELDGFPLLKCLREKGVSCGQGRVAGDTRTGMEICRIAGLAMVHVPLPS